MNNHEFIAKYLSPFPEAHCFVNGFIALCHAIDDIIDGDEDDSEHILQTFELALTLYSSDFYKKNSNHLFPIIKMVTNSYADSVILEQGLELWKTHTADILRHASNDVILAVIELCCGIKSRREASIQLRERSYKQHHDDKGKSN